MISAELWEAFKNKAGTENRGSEGKEQIQESEDRFFFKAPTIINILWEIFLKSASIKQGIKENTWEQENSTK